MRKITQAKITQAMQIRTVILNACRTWLLSVAVALSFGGNVQAGEAVITGVEIKPAGDGVYQISVTLQHEDTGWDHYANRWDVLDEEGNLLGVRELLHPHVNEQPFTRSLRVKIPESVKAVTIVAADSVHLNNEETVTVEVPKE